MTALRSVVLLGLVGCTAGTDILGDTADTGLGGAVSPEATWLSSWDWTWAVTNHRIGAFSVRPGLDGGVDAYVVGGASTHGTWFGEDTACNDGGDCGEFPASDTTAIAATRVDATSDAVGFVERTVTVSLEPDTSEADGRQTASGFANVPLPGGARAAWIAGLAVDLQEPLLQGAEAVTCYDPRHGWLPQRLLVDLATTGEGLAAVTTVTASVGFGATFEEVRACLDAALPFARARITVDVVALVDPDEAAAITRHPVAQGASWPWSDGEPVPDQSLDEIGSTALVLDDAALVGWEAMAWTFHTTVEPGRGAYLRQLAVVADPSSDVAYGLARNAAPSLFLQSGFDYGFAGRVLEIDAPVERTTSLWGDDALPANIDDAGVPVAVPLSGR